MQIRGKGLKDFKFVTFIGRLPTDGAASMVVKGLMKHVDRLCLTEYKTEADLSFNCFTMGSDVSSFNGTTGTHTERRPIGFMKHPLNA